MVIWMIGLSGSGKTTLGKKLFESLSNNDKSWVFLDGDDLRRIVGDSLGHTIEERRVNAYRMSNFCNYLSSQNLNVVACILSIFHDNQQYNRENLKDYKEVYIDVSMENLLKRDNKNLYKRALEGKEKNVVGVDIEFPPPFAPDVVIDNNIEFAYEEKVETILSSLKLKKPNIYRYTENNLLDSPHKYQYSKNEGKKFFEGYYENRKSSLSILKERIEKVCKCDNSFKDNILNKEEILNSKAFFLELLELIEENKNLTQLQEKNLLTIVKRFEVSKKIYDEYSAVEVKKQGTECKNLINYLLFSNVLSSYYFHIDCKKKRIILFNALLKVNDIISSAIYELVTYKEITLAMKAFESEMEIANEFRGSL